jgi:eukaryotic-like serine/threonine-protein kinase
MASRPPIAPPEPWPREHLLAGRYRRGEPLGHGGMSTVYRALDLSLNREVAVKVIRTEAAPRVDPAHLRERFRREAATAARIPPHPNLVQVYDYGTDPQLDLDFIVMELLRGRDLKQELRNGPPAVAVALRILLHVARGLAAGHRAGVVHRDVKPGNVLLVGEAGVDSVRVLDFGIAKAVAGDPEDVDDADDDLTRVGGLPHTPAYASPEQLDPSVPVTPASDVYQLGLLGYELLAGTRPFEAEERERIRAGMDVPLAGRGRWREVPPAAREVLETALQRDPAGRYPDAAAFAEALSVADAEEDRTRFAPPVTGPAAPAAAAVQDPEHTVAVEQGPAGVRVARPKRTPPAALLLAVVAGVALLLVFFLLARGGGGEESGGGAEAAELEEVFRELYHEAAERIADD